MPYNQIAILKDHHPEELGFLPSFIDQNDPRCARDQFDANYQHGGGWNPIQGATNKHMVLTFPGDPPFEPIAMWPLRRRNDRDLPPQHRRDFQYQRRFVLGGEDGLMTGMVKIVQDTTLPTGRCVVLIDGDIAYAGQIGVPMIRFILQPDAVMILSPADFADGAAFMMEAMKPPN